MEVPVVVTTVSAQQMDRMGTTSLSDLPKLVPGLSMGHGLLSVGAQISIRGVGTISLDPGIDQSVSLNVDGLQLTQGLAFLSALNDAGSVEVLKGPQALFFGKSSPGGVMAIRTADPTDEFEVIAGGSYEFVANERRGNLIVSGPVTNTLGARFTGQYSGGDGYFRNIAVPIPGTGARAPFDRAPNTEGYLLRGTLVWDPSSRFDARLKANIVRDRAIAAETAQLVSCPDGVGAPSGISFIDPSEDCKLDRNIRTVFMDPAAFPGIPNDGVPYLRTNQKYGSLEMNYYPSDEITLTSVTGYYNLNSSSLVNSSISQASGPVLAIDNNFKRRDFTQELRLSSDFSSPINFTLGAFYQDGRFNNRVVQRASEVYRNRLNAPSILANGFINVDIKTYSAFGQLRWDVASDLELAGGVRWTNEERREFANNLISGVAVPFAITQPVIKSDNFAPEFTATYRPTSDLTIFGAWKKGFKSGSFNVATINPNALTGEINNAFGDEEVQGGEVGAKARLFDRQLYLEVAGYRYTYEGLQVGAQAPQGEGRPPVVRTVNAGEARVHGIDFDASFRPHAVEGLSVRTAVNWNRGRFIELNNIPCYGGQMVSEGCDLLPNSTTGRFTAQNLSGTPMVRAPEWQITAGFDYEMPVGNGMNLVLSNSNQYSSRYVTFLSLRPDRFQEHFIKSDLSLALQGPQDRWEVALIGKNITDQVTAGTCGANNAANSLVLGGQNTGGTTRGLAGVDEVNCYSQRGREIMLRLTVRPFNN